MNNLNWQGIRSFLAVAEHGSFTAAAEATGFSKSNLSQQVSALEQQLGVQLLLRSTRRLRLTEVGEGYAEQCRRALQQLNDAADWAVQSTSSLSGRINVNSVGGLIGEEVVAPLLIRFQQQYPGIEIALDFSSRSEDLLAGNLDLVVRIGELPDSSLVARPLHKVSTRYVASPDFLARAGEIDHPQQLKRLPLICGSIREWHFYRDQEHCIVHAGEGFRIANGRVMLQAAKAGLGVARLIDIYVDQALVRGELVEVLPQWRLDTPLSLVCPPARHRLQRVRLLMEWLQAEFRQAYSSCARSM
ncbi:LysR family transcriptional regulator [Marinobacterium jannaschii]|uniref:LysR family transcriptional regulator n=1 Tax=Marinobacterium jannaschii TaxID=64970 RepID=UPI00048A2754|nr:LysR family transcriptional regulator [Marinobacterium jannaschii]